MSVADPSDRRALNDRSIASDEYRAAMRRLPQPVSILTTIQDGVRYGIVATSVASVSVSPPTLVACIDRASATHGAIEASGLFCVNTLSVTDKAIAEQFADPARRDQRFTLGTWMDMPSGAPGLATAQAVFDCSIVSRLDYGSHTLFLGRVTDARSASGIETDPLLYLDRAFRGLAPV